MSRTPSSTADVASLDDQDRLILQQLLEETDVSISALEESIGLSRQALNRRVNRLIEHKLVQALGQGPSTVYRIGAATSTAVELAIPGEGLEAQLRRQLYGHFYHVRRTNDKEAEQTRSEMGKTRPPAYIDIFNMVPVAVSVDGSLRVTAWSRAFARAFGTPKENIPLSDLFRDQVRMVVWSLEQDRPEPDKDFLELLIRAFCGSGSADHPKLNPTLVRTAGGEERFFEVVATAQRAYAGMQIIAIDVTERVESRRQLTNTMASWYALRHQIRQPMNVVRGVNEVLRTFLQHKLVDPDDSLRGVIDALETAPGGDAAKAELRNSITRWREQLLDITGRLDNSLRELSGIAKDLPLPKDLGNEPIPIRPLLEIVVDSERDSFAESNGVAILSKFEGLNPRCLVEGNIFLLREGLRCLVRNAARSCLGERAEARKIVIVSAELKETKLVRIEIVDQGMGLTDLQIESFNQLAAEAKPGDVNDPGRISGTHVAMRAVKRSNGQLLFRKGANSIGTVVSIDIPLWRES